MIEVVFDETKEEKVVVPNEDFVTIDFTGVVRFYHYEYGKLRKFVVDADGYMFDYSISKTTVEQHLNVEDENEREFIANLRITATKA